MTQSQTSPRLKPDEYAAQQQGVIPDHQRALQEVVSDAHTAVQSIRPQYPIWPTSKPGPWSTPPPSGTRPINAQRREQVVAFGHGQQQVEPNAADSLRTGSGETIDQQYLRQAKRKERL